MQAQFLQLISHELRTPLTGIRGYSDLLAAERAGPLTDRQRHMLTMLNSCVHRLDSLIDDLLLLASVDAGMYGLVVEDLDVARACERAVRTHTAHARPGEPVWRTARADRPCVVQADPRQLDHLLAALLNHAAGAFAGQAELVLTAAPDDPGVRITVSGTAAPATAEDPAGLGLAVVRAVAEQHGGAVTVGDTAIRVALPHLARPGARLRVVDRPRVRRVA
ncbi:HAMP domain-containing histidine kinase [Dactylosporangium roseum]|uniref:histidine kinase n=1 Tax=Dactylosporangium roseum TaxID=47989 RepID=A0ABY5YYE5_9ACTN|nr:HAMP domain-containing sensor histidine kinase [Dactylosporangium roseum]UWZ33672.1 HAMP domain-containing histidine kinase [Dactylosporangium roseum]